MKRRQHARPLPKPPPQPQKPPHPGDLKWIIERLVEEQRISYAQHALEVRMPERGFDFDDVETILLNGMIEGRITPGRRVGEWECLVVGKLELNGRDAGVATVIVKQHRLIIKTVEWIDP